MMNADGGRVDLELALGYSNDCIRTRLNENSGAGVNASSLADMTFAASDSLAELVWSPHNGLSLKCAECSLANKKPLLLNVGPSNSIPSPSQSMRCGINDDKKVEGNLIISQPADREIFQGASLTQFPGNSARPIVGISRGHTESRDGMDERKLEKGVLVKNRSQNADHLGGADKELYDPDNHQMTEMAERSQKNTGPNISNFEMAITEASPRNLNKEISSDLNPIVRNAAVRGQILEEFNTTAEVQMEVLSEAHVTVPQGAACLDEPTKEVRGAIGKERKCKLNRRGSVLPVMDKLECTAENDPQHTINSDAYEQGKERLLRGCSVPLQTSLKNSSRHSYPLESKEKDLSDSKVCGIYSHDTDDSQESAESCNSEGLLRKRQRNFDQQLIYESKRIKKKTEGCPASTSIGRQYSSFMNWISNLVKGFSKSDQTEGRSLDLTLAHASHEHTSILQETTICSKHQDSVSRNMGFQTIFKSLYCPSTKLVEAEVSGDDWSVEQLQDLLQADKTNIRSSPISSLQNRISTGHIFMENEKSLPSPTQVIPSQSDQPRKLSANPLTQNDSKTEPAEDKTPNKQECCKCENEASSSDSLSHHKITASENDSPHLASDGRARYDLSYRNNLLGSLWITRFSAKTSSTSLNLNHSNKDDCQAMNCPGDFTRSDPQNQTYAGHPMVEKYSVTRVNSSENSVGDLRKGLLTFTANANLYLGFKEICVHKYQNSVLKQHSLLSSLRFKSSDVVASSFARRLDVFKHIIPSEIKDDAACTAPTCFFCGKSGHSLWDCSEVMETELEDLLRNMSSYDWSEDSPSFCIRCSQSDHWAIMCPLVSSSRQQKLENKIFSIKFWNASNQELGSSNEIKYCFLDKEDSHKVAICSREETFMNTDLRRSSSNGTQNQVTSTSGNNAAKEHHNLPLCNIGSMQISEVPEGFFDAMRRLQLFRADILKWINSNVSLSCLEGLFLRLRLGNWEAGFGGTRYCVAFITDQGGEAAKDPETCICVNVGGNKCRIGSQYVSNHEFLEDELLAWRSRTLKSGGKIPSKEDLASKFEQRIKLGLQGPV